MTQSEAVKEHAADVLNAFSHLIEVFVASFGRIGTVLMFVGMLLVAVAWRLYNDRRKDKEINAAVLEKNRTIRRLAEQERNYRILFFKDKAGWTDEEVERFIVENEFDGTPIRRKLKD